MWPTACWTETMTSAALLAGLALSPFGVPHYWGLAEIEGSPALAVGTVEQVVKLGPVPRQLYEGRWPRHYYEAHLLVHRVFFNTADRPFEPPGRIAVRYITDDSCTAGCGGGGGFSEPPYFLDLHQGQVALFSLKRAKAGWTLGGIGGRSTVLPAYLADPTFGDPPRTGLTFILRELTNAVTHGSAAERSHAAAFFLTASTGIPPELPRLIRAALGKNDDEWLETGCAFLGHLVGPRQTGEIVYGEASPPFDHIQKLVTWILWKGDRRDYPNRLIRRLLRNSPAYSWGAANILVDFKDSTVLIDELNARLRRGAGAATTVAWFIVKSGQRAVLPEALNLAQKQVSNPAPVPADELRIAAQMLATYGDDRQFESLAAAMQRLRQQDEPHYRELWFGAASPQNQRRLRLSAILIDDRRQFSGGLRYCDYAAWMVQTLSGAKFGTGRIEEMSAADRDRFVGRAAAWLESHRGGS